MSIFTFDEKTNEQISENIIQKPLINQNLENLFEDKLMYLDESIRDVLVSYTPSKEIIDLSVEVMFEDELKFLGIDVVDTPIKIGNDDKFMRSKSEKKSKRR